MLNITGLDNPGITSRLFAALPDNISVIDVEQVVVKGILTLAVLVELEHETQASPVADVVRQALRDYGMQVSSEITTNEDNDHPAQLVITVLGSPLSGSALARISEIVANSGANIDRIERIASYPVTALELKISQGEITGLRRTLAAAGAEHGFDIAVQEGGLRRRGRQLVVMDVDSTVIQDEVVELLANHAGVGKEVKEITDRAMAGELDFESSLRERVSLLAGLPENVFEKVFSEIRLTPGAKTLCRVLKSLDFHIALVSGGFLQVVEPLGALLNVDHIQANNLEVIDGKLTGKILGEVVDRAGKAKALRNFAEDHNIPLARTIAIGDGANDLDMLDAAGLGIAFNAKPIVQSAADAAVNVPYLDTVLYMLGITRAEIEKFDADSGLEIEYKPIHHHHNH
ncbi:MAG: phosphoserine phosphatase SerB [Actinomycetota bacterium]|jgi:phosphoserine phosphatase